MGIIRDMRESRDWRESLVCVSNIETYSRVGACFYLKKKYTRDCCESRNLGAIVSNI